MTIRLELTAPRRVVYWAGKDVSDDLESEILHRNLELKPLIPEMARDQTRIGKAVIYTVGRSKLGPFFRFLEGEAWDYLVAGHYIQVLVQGPDDLGRIQDKISHWKSSHGIPDTESPIRIRQVEDNPAEIAQTLAEYNPGPGLNPDLQIDNFPSGPEAARFVPLFKRVFSDFDRIELTAMPTGYRSQFVFQVYAIKGVSETTNRPLAFFVKSGTREEIEQEKQHYLRYVEGFIPVANRPGFAADRSWTERDGLGLLVCTFLDGSESLLAASYRRNIHHAIHLLFEDALRCWIDNSHSNSVPDELSLYESSGRILPESVSAERSLSAARKFGSTHTFDQLKNCLKSFPKVKHRIGRIHGDFHARNVLLRGDHPVVIDFSAIDFGPGSTDASNLEVSIVFHGYEAMDNKMRLANKDHWIEYARSLYSLPAVARSVGPRVRQSFISNPHSGIRSIRLHGQSLCVEPALEYPIMIAFQLLRFSSHCDDCQGDSTARDLAYALAEDIILGMSAGT